MVVNSTHATAGDRAPFLFGLSAPPRHGKTSAVCALAEALRRQGVGVSGVAQPARTRFLEGKEEVLGYDLLDLLNQESVPFAQRVPPGEGEVGRMRFRLDPNGMAWAAERILQPVEVAFVDELGWVEAEGGGHMPALLEALQRRLQKVVVLAFRPALQEVFATKLAPYAVGFNQIWSPAPRHGERMQVGWVGRILEVLEGR